jgi:hypothetical protein
MLYPQVGPDSGQNLDDLRTAVTTAWRLRQRSRYEELGRYLPVVLPDLSAAATRATSEAAQDSTTRLLVHILNATSSLLKRLGAYDLALVAADRAIESSRRLDDPLLTAAAVHRLANVLLPAGRLDQCRDVAVRAADTIQSGGRQSPEGLGMWGALLLTAAVATARRGDSSRAWELLGEARAAGRLLGQDRADLFAVFGPVNAEIHAVQIAVELGDGHGAILRSAQVDPDGLPDYLIERRAQYLLDLTQAHILDANYSDAASSLCEADAAASEEVRFDPAARSALRLLLSKRPSASTSPLREMATRFGVE